MILSKITHSPPRITLRRSVLTIGLAIVVTVAGLGQNTKENADFKLAVNLYKDGLYDLAVEQLKQFVNAYPGTPQGIDARFYLGLTQLKLKLYDDARLTFQTFALTYQDNPKAPEAWWNVGEAYAALKNTREAALAFERVKVFHPKDKSAPDALLRASHFFMLAGQRDDAMRMLRSILQEYPTSPPTLQARTELARLYFQEGNVDQAQTELRRVVEGDPSPEAKAQALLILGNIYQTTGRIDQAEANYQEILKNHATTFAVPGAHLALGKLLAAAGKPIEAIDHFKKVLADKSGGDSLLYKDALIATGNAHAALKDYANAVSVFERFLSFGSGDERAPGILWNIADAAARERQYRRSNDACNQIIRSAAPDPLKKRALIRLAFNATEQGASVQAGQYLSAYAEQYPDDLSTPEVLYRLASLTELQLRDPRKAAGWYALLSNRSTPSPLVDDALMGEARCYEQLREPVRAREAYREIIEKYPASDFRPEAERRSSAIEIFEAKDKDAGLEKLALLVGDVVSEHDKVLLAFRLGLIYFADLKNYGAAASQFTNALEGGIAEPQAAEALLDRARCYEYLSRSTATLAPYAVAGYELFLRKYPNDPRSRESALALFSLRSTTLAEATKAYDTLSSVLSSPSDRAAMTLVLARLQEDSDSLPAALSTLSRIPVTDPSSPTAEKASYRTIILLQKLGLSDSILKEVTAYLSAFPTGEHAPAVLQIAASVSLKMGNPARAAEFYDQLANNFSYTRAAVDTRRDLADAYAGAGNYPAAINTYLLLYRQATESPLSTQEPDPSLLLALGKAYHAAADNPEAKKYLFILLSREQTGPLAGMAYQTLGQIARDAGSLDDAASYFRQAETASPGTGTSRDIANLLFDRGDYAGAIRNYSELLRGTTTDSDRQDLEARVIISRLRANGPASVEKDISAFAKSFKNVDSLLATFQLEIGLYKFGKEDYPGAQKAFQIVAERYEETTVATVAQYWSAKTLEAQEKPQEAVKILETLIQAHPQAEILQKAYLTLGNIWYNAERWDEAMKNYRQIIESPNPDTALVPMAMSNLIETDDAAGAYDAALTLTRKYLERYPNADDALDKKIKIGILYDKLGFYDQAVLQLQSLLDIAGSDLEGELRYYIAEANFNKGDYQQAILDFLKVPYLVTKKGKIDWTANSLYMAGQAYEKMGRFDQALTMYKQILDRPGIDPTYKIAAKKEIDRVKLVVKQKPG